MQITYDHRQSVHMVPMPLPGEIEFDMRLEEIPMDSATFLMVIDSDFAPIFFIDVDKNRSIRFSKRSLSDHEWSHFVADMRCPVKSWIRFVVRYSESSMSIRCPEMGSHIVCETDVMFDMCRASGISFGDPMNLMSNPKLGSVLMRNFSISGMSGRKTIEIRTPKIIER